MELVVIVVLGAMLVGAALAVAAALAAGESDRSRVVEESERAAAWEAGYTDRDLRVLAGLAAAAHSELCAGEVEVVLTHVGGDGVVVTGSRIASDRLGRRVPQGDGLAGRSLAEGRTTRTRDGAVSVPIPSGGRVVGVVSVTAGAGPLGDSDVARLEALAAEAGRRLGPPDGVTGDEPTPRRDVG